MKSSLLMRLGAVERWMAAQSAAPGHRIAADLEAVCSSPSHPERHAALEFAEFLSGHSSEELRAGRVDATGLSDAALHFSIRLLQGALGQAAKTH